MGTRPALYISKEREGGKRRRGRDSKLWEKTSLIQYPWNPAQHFLNDVISFSLALHLHLHLLSPSILPGRSASRTHMLTSPPSPPHLRDVRCMTKYEASCSGLRDPDKSRSPLFFFLAFSILSHSFTLQPHSIIWQNTMLTEKQMTVSCMHRAREQGDILRMSFFNGQQGKRREHRGKRTRGCPSPLHTMKLFSSFCFLKAVLISAEHCRQVWPGWRHNKVSMRKKKSFSGRLRGQDASFLVYLRFITKDTVRHILRIYLSKKLKNV